MIMKIRVLFLFIVLLAITPLCMSQAEYYNTPTSDTITYKDTTTVLNATKSVAAKVSSPIPLWQWLLLGLFGSVGFGMLLNRRLAGVLLFTAISIIIALKLKTAIEFKFDLWPFVAWGSWIILTSKISKKASSHRIQNKQYNTKHKSEAIALINQAYDVIEKQDFYKAKSLLEESFKIDDSIPEAHSEYAFVMSTIGNIDFAIDHMIKAAMLNIHEPKFWSNLSYQYYLNNQNRKAMTSTYLAEIVNKSYPSISQSKALIREKFADFDIHAPACKSRATQIWNVLNRTSEALPPQSGDINQLMDPQINFFL